MNRTVAAFHIPTLIAMLSMTAVGAADDPKPSGVRVYRCELQGKVTYSDTVCDKMPGKTKIVVPPLENRFAPPESTLPEVGARDDRSSPERPKRTDRRSIAEEQAEHKLRCRNIDTQIEQLGKALREANSNNARSVMSVLNEQMEALEKQRRTEKCR